MTRYDQVQPLGSGAAVFIKRLLERPECLDVQMLRVWQAKGSYGPP